MKDDTTRLVDIFAPLAEAAEVLRRVNEMLDSISPEGIRRSATVGKLWDFADVLHGFNDVSTRVIEIERAAQSALIKSRELMMNLLLEENSLPDDDYESKKKMVVGFNAMLREAKAAIARPNSGEPCILFAMPSRGPEGRYTLESRGTKKRAGSYQSLKELIPIRLVPDISRKEGVIERRKKLEKPKD